MRTASRIALLVLLAASFDCTTFAPLPANSCGNGVVENGEDCDTFARGATACRAPDSPVGACRLDCSSTPCPSGWGCGTDFVCRQSSGRFTRQPSAIAAGAWRVQAGDFDGDHRQDLLTREPIDINGLSKLRLHFFDENAALTKTLIIPPSLAYPRVIDIDGDKLADLVFANPGSGTINPGGVGTMLGQSDRTLVPVAYPTFTFPAVARAIAFHGIPGQATSFAAFVKDPRGSVLIATDDTTQVLAALPGGPDDIAGDISVARVFEDPTQFPCEELVVSFAKSNDVLLYPMCKRAGTKVLLNDAGVAGLVHVQLTGTAKVDRGVRVADVNADGHLDILVGVLDGMPPVAKTFIAYGTGGPAFKSDPAGAVDGKAAIFRIAASELGEVFEPELPLAVGDMNKDGTPDFVLTAYVLASLGGTTPTGDAGADGGDGGVMSGTPQYAVAGRKSLGAWTQAAIADFNGNGFPDAVAGSSDGLDIDFFNANAGTIFSTFSLTTNGPASQFSVGDVDGDYFPDLVFAQSFGGISGDQLAVSYGRTGGPPETPTVIGRFEHIVQTESFSQGTAVDSIGVVSRPYDARATLVSSVSLLLGSGDREPLALFSLTHPKVNVGLPDASVPGLFTKSGNIDVAAFAKDQSSGAYRLWLMKATGATPAPQFQTAMDGPALPNTVNPKIGLKTTILIAQGDLTGDGVPEVIVVTPFGTTLDGSNTQLTIASPRPGDMAVPFDVRDPIALGIPATQEGQLAVYDVDMDGALDVVLLMGADDAGQLVVYWNDGKGNFDPKNSTAMNLPSEAPTGFSSINVGANEPPALAYVTRRTVVIAHLDPKDRTSVRREKIDAPTDASGIVSGDVDGDGVDDLAIADSNNLVILRAEAVLK